ncbi:glycosyltransferase [Candidatus Gottesmanbacteria bacterium]|nr:glycosyltransferase [Candidatus Gottesmanbacteria bacterium]
MKKLRVSVCIPCYNAERFIEKSVRSVLCQSYTNFVLHIIDNASTDNTLDIVSHIKDSRIRIHKNTRNIGMFNNMNRCLSIATSPYVKILCADDLLQADCLKKQVEVLNRYPEVGLVYGASAIVNANGKPVFTRRFFSRDTRIAGKDLVRRMVAHGRNFIGEPTTVMIRNSFVRKRKLRYNPQYVHMGDIDFWIQILLNSDGYYLARVLSSFRVHSASSTVSVLRKIFPDYQRLFSTYKNRLEMPRGAAWLGTLLVGVFFVFKSIFLFVVKWTENEKEIDKSVRRRDV